MPQNIPSQLGANKVTIVGEYEYNKIDIFYQYINSFRSIFNAVFRLDYGIGTGENASRGIVFGIGQYF